MINRRKKKKETEYRVDETREVLLLAKREFDLDQNIIWEQSFYPSGKVQSVMEAEYQSGKRVREKYWNEFGDWTENEFSYNEKEEINFQKTKYSKGGEEVMKMSHEDGKDIIEFFDFDNYLVSQEICYYNSKCEIYKKIFFEEGEKIETQEYTLDSKGRLIEEKAFFISEDNEDTFIETKYRYDSYDNEIEIIKINAAGFILNKIQSKFDKFKILEQRINDFDESETVIIVKYEYDLNDRLLKRSEENIYGKVFQQELYHYDDQLSRINYTSISSADGGIEFNHIPRKEMIRIDIEYY